MQAKNAPAYSPIARLPTEILSEIFKDYVDLPAHRLWPPHPQVFADRPYDAALVVKQVDRPFYLRCICRHWRAVVESTPQLWTRNRIAGDVEENPELLDDVSRRVRWSGDHLPLTLYINCGVWGREALEALVAFLHRYASRWHHLHLNVPSEFFNFLVEPKAITFPSLETFSLAAEVDLASVKDLVGHTSFPNVTTFRFCEEMILELEAQNTVAWEKLTTIDVEPLYLSEILYILHQARQLLHFRIGAALNDSSGLIGISNSQAVHLPSLRTLDIAGLYRRVACLNIVRLIKAPQLKRLRVASRSFEHPTLIDCVTQLLAQSGCSLDVLILIQHDKEPSLTGMDEPARRLQVERSHLVLIDGAPRQPPPPDIWGDHWEHLCSHCFYGEVQLYSEHSCPPSCRHISPSI